MNKYIYRAKDIDTGEWAKCCAMVAIPAEISDRVHDIMQKMEG